MTVKNVDFGDQLHGTADAIVYHALGMPFAQAASTSTTGFALVREDGCVIWANAAFAVLTCLRGSPVGVRLDEQLDLQFRLADGEAAHALAQNTGSTLELDQGRTASPVHLHIAALDGEMRVVVAAAPHAEAPVGAMHTSFSNTMIDPLTRLGNQRQLLQQLDNWPFEHDYALLCLDIDGFGDVNESLGRVDADRVLQLVADRLTRASRAGDKVYRTDGDEFVILHPNSEGSAHASAMAERLISLFDRPFRLDDNLVQMSASIGIAVSSATRAVSGEKVLADTRAAVRDAHRAGGHCSCVHEPDE